MKSYQSTRTGSVRLKNENLNEIGDKKNWDNVL
jgi:hypothetical protein